MSKPLSANAKELRNIKAVVRSGVGYDIIAAIRGPDCENSSLKEIFTERIRFLVGCTEDRLKFTLKTYSPRTRDSTTIYSGDIRSAFAYKTQTHYLKHARAALEALSELKTGAVKKELIALGIFAERFAYYATAKAAIEDAKALGLNVNTY